MSQLPRAGDIGGERSDALDDDTDDVVDAPRRDAACVRLRRRARGVVAMLLGVVVDVVGVAEEVVVAAVVIVAALDQAPDGATFVARTRCATSGSRRNGRSDSSSSICSNVRRLSPSTSMPPASNAPRRATHSSNSRRASRASSSTPAARANVATATSPQRCSIAA